MKHVSSLPLRLLQFWILQRTLTDTDCPNASEADNQSVRSSASVVSRCFPGGYNVKLYISRGRLAWWLLAFLQSEIKWLNVQKLQHGSVQDAALICNGTAVIHACIARSLGKCYCVLWAECHITQPLYFKHPSPVIKSNTQCELTKIHVKVSLCPAYFSYNSMLFKMSKSVICYNGVILYNGTAAVVCKRNSHVSGAVYQKTQVTGGCKQHVWTHFVSATPLLKCMSDHKSCYPKLLASQMSIEVIIYNSTMFWNHTW